MLAYLRTFLQAPKFADEERTRVAGIVHTITLGTWIVPLVFFIVISIFPDFAEKGIPLAFGLILLNLAVTVLTRTGYIRAASLMLVTVLVLISSYVSYSFGAQPRPYLLFFAWIILIAGLILGRVAAIFIAVYFLVLQAGLSFLADNGLITVPDSPTSILTNSVIYAASFLLIAGTVNLAQRNIQTLFSQRIQNEKNLEYSNQELTKLTNTLETRITTRTTDLEKANQRIEKRAKQFQAIAQVSRVIIAAQNLQDVLPQITEVISEQFGFYHVGVFLVDANRQYAVLSAANSDGGTRMLDRGHKLRIGQVGIVGNVAKSGKVRIALDTGSDAIYFNNPDLPETRSEMALPLFQSSGTIIGVLDIQSTEPDAFAQDDIDVLTTLAEQVSVAITNAQLYEETQRALIESEMIYRQDLKSSWKRFTRSQNLAGIRRRNMKSHFIIEPINVPGANEAVVFGNTYQRPAGSKDEMSELTMPIKLRSEVVGTLNIKSATKQKWSPDELDIITAIIDRAALSIENARLLSESRKIAERERAIGNISSRIGEGTDIETILQTAIRELGTQISGAKISVEIGGDDE